MYIVFLLLNGNLSVLKTLILAFILVLSNRSVIHVKIYLHKMKAFLISLLHYDLLRL